MYPTFFREYMEKEKKGKVVYKVCLSDSRGPCYLVYKEALAKQLKEKLDQEYGQEFKIIFEKYILPATHK